MCDDPTSTCHLNNCESYPGTKYLYNFLANLLNKAHTSDVLFSVWHSIDRATLKIEYLPVQDFVQELCERLIYSEDSSLYCERTSSFSHHLEKNKKKILKLKKYLLNAIFLKTMHLLCKMLRRHSTTITINALYILSCGIITVEKR